MIRSICSFLSHRNWISEEELEKRVDEFVNEYSTEPEKFKKYLPKLKSVFPEHVLCNSKFQYDKIVPIY